MTLVERDALEVTAFERPADFAEHFKTLYGPTIAVRANAGKEGRGDELDAALDEVFERSNRGDADNARFEMEYLLAVGTKRGDA